MGYEEFISTDNQGFVGGIIVAWNKSNACMELCAKKSQFIHMQTETLSQQRFLFRVVYASPYEGNEKLLWEDLMKIKEDVKELWLMTGNFNDILTMDVG